MRINNNAFQRDANLSMVAQAIWRRPGISRIDIARELNLYRSTVTNIIQTLIDAGVVYEAEAGEGLPQGGRKPIMLRVNEQIGCVLGIELQPEYFRGAVVDVYGRTLASAEGALVPGDFADEFDQAYTRMKPAAEAAGRPLLGICAGIPGIIDPADGWILRSDPFGLSDYPFRVETSHRYPVPVLIENDANCCAWEQLTLHRGEDLDDFLCVLAECRAPNKRREARAGLAVGLGVALGGTLHYGKRFAAGEFASVRWREGAAGQFAIPEAEAGWLAVDDAVFAAVIAELFVSLTTVVSVLDPQAVFLHGDLCRREAIVRGVFAASGALRAVMERRGCRLEFSAGGDLDVAHGAASMFLQRLFTVPELSDAFTASRPTWDDVFMLQQAVQR